MAEAIKIAVRVRPFNEKETAANQQLCIEMTKTKVSVLDLSGEKKQKDFTFDHAFWSFDQFTIDETGYNTPTASGKYTDQKEVWNLLGTSVLDKAWKGLNNTIFAYGQTGAGKSYSIFGYTGNAGIIPMAATELFRRIGAETESNVRYEVSVQMVEIYMEKIQDLLVHSSKRGAPLAIKQSKAGIYVHGAVKTVVSNYNDIQRVIDIGEGNRTIGSTQMNQTSSRSHTVVTIDFAKVTTMAGKDGRLKSMINIVDLAGSEKSNQAGTTGDRLAEGNAINKSLSCLGNVIEVLADHAMGLNKKRVVPYRDSALTRMLQDAIGGNSATIMVCAIRPGHTYYEETLGTLRYADRAKKIKNKPTVNEDPQAKLIRELQEENAKLRAQLGSGGGGGGGGDPEAQAKLEAAEEQMRLNELEMAELSKSWEDKLEEQNHKNDAEEAEKRAIEVAKTSGNPQILNLNEDGMLDRKIFVDLSKHNAAKVGRKQPAGDQPEICLGGIGIESQHATFQTSGDHTNLVPASAASATHCYVNGVKLTSADPVELKPNDRVIFGTGTVLLYRCQSRDAEVELKDDPADPISYEFAMREKQKLEDAEEEAEKAEAKARQEEENAAKMNELRAQMEVEKAEQEAAAAVIKQQMEEQMAALRSEVDAKHNDEEAKQQAVEREAQLRIEMEFKLEAEKIAAAEREVARQDRIKKEEEMIKLRQAENSALEQKLEEILPKVREANMIAAEFNRDIRFNSQLTSAMPDFGDLKSEKRIFAVKTDNREDQYFYIWNPDKFLNRVELMREMFNEYVESGGSMPDFSDKDHDPFWDPPEPQLIGKSYLQLKNLGYMLDCEATPQIFTTDSNVKGGVGGTLKCSYWPCDMTGLEDAPDDLLVDDPSELMGKEVFFRVEVEGAENLPNDLCKDSHVNYIFKHEPDVIHRVPTVDGKNKNPVFNFKKVHRFEEVNDYMLDYINTGSIVFKTYASPDFGQMAPSPMPTATPQSKKSAAAQQSAAPASKPPVKSVAAASEKSSKAPSGTDSAATKSSEPVAVNGATIAVVDGKKGSSCCTIF